MSNREKLWRAVVDSFDGSELTRLLRFNMGIDLDNNVGPGSHEDRTFNLIEYLDRQGQLEEFALSVRVARPNKPEIAAVTSLFLTDPLDTDDPLAGPPREGNESARDARQRVVRERSSYQNYDVARAKSDQISTRICSIGFPVSGGRLYGTGVLVGPDLVLTNYHVLEPVIDSGATNTGAVPPESVELSFDHRTNLYGVILGAPTVVKLVRDNWLLASSPCAPQDREPDSGDAPLTKLDYALVRIDRPLGREPIYHVPGYETPARGWIAFSSGDADIKKGDDVNLFQHPDARPLQITWGRVGEKNGNGSRLRYDANSGKGSSGGAVVSLSRFHQFIALHHAGDPNFDRLAHFNQGIPVHLIADDLTKKGVLLEVPA